MKNTICLHNMGRENYHLPKPINFVRRCHDDFPVPLGELSDSQVRKLGEAITEAMILKAQRQRSMGTTFDNTHPPRRGRGPQ